MRELDDLFVALAQSRFRRGFKLNHQDLRYLQQRGLETVLHHARELIAQRLAPAQPINDGRQTPWRGHPVFVAQHATATCCRGCLQKWHHIPRGRALTPAEVEHILSVLKRWLGPFATPAPASLPADPQLSLGFSCDNPAGASESTARSLSHEPHERAIPRRPRSA